MKHGHQCGYDGMTYDPKQGCGHEWEHRDSVIFLPQKDYEEAHQCPKCGKGPWLHKTVKNESGAKSLLLLLDELEGFFNGRENHR